MPCMEVITSNDVLIKDINRYFLSLRMKGKFIPEIPGENVSYPGKKIPRPGPTRNKIPRPDPARKYSLKCSPTPDKFRSGPVRSGETRGFGLPRRSLCPIHVYQYLHSSRYWRGWEKRKKRKKRKKKNKQTNKQTNKKHLPDSVPCVFKFFITNRLTK